MQWGHVFNVIMLCLQHVQGCRALDLILSREQVVTEAEWLVFTDPEPVLKCLPGNAKQIRVTPLGQLRTGRESPRRGIRGRRPAGKARPAVGLQRVGIRARRRKWTDRICQLPV
jgi:hypothetical protein